jgi:hypothetical protein
MSWGVALRNAVGLGLGSVPSLLNAPPYAALKLNFTEVSALDSRITFTRASSATYFNSAGVLSTAANNVARFDYNPVTLAPFGLLIEESRTNTCLYSSDLTNVTWVYSANAVITGDTGVAPDGTTTADTITVNGVNNGVYQIIPCASSTAYTFSLWVKLGTMAASDYKFAIYDNTNSAFIASDIVPTQTPTASSWTRITYTFTTPATCVSVRVYCFRNSLSAATSVNVWGLQLESGAFVTSHIPTTTTALTRAADAASVTGANFSSVFNATQGTMFVQAQQNILFAASKSAASVNDGTSANRLTLYRQSAGGINAFANPPGAVVAGPLATAGVPWKSALAYGAASPALFAVNGATQTSLTYGVNPSVFTEFTIGNAFAGGGEHFNGYIRSFAYYPKRLSAGQLQTLTK